MTDQHAILSVKNLSVGYTTSGTPQEVLSHLDLALHPSSLVCFMGPNGVGKSTLLRTLCGAQPPLTGRITVAGNDLNTLSKMQLASRIAVVLTDKINVGNMSAREVVALGRYPYQGWSLNQTKEDIAAIEKAIENTKLEAFAHKKIAQLSDGQRQKTMIARALCQDTPIIILDEPTAHLDLNNRVEVINLLKELAKEGEKAVLMATHELDLALQTADELWMAGFNAPVTTGFPEDLVLSGQIDEVFQLKGFDLKTGHLEKKISKRKVKVTGDSYQLLWTKNALERNGYGLDDDADLSISILNDDDRCVWQINNERQFNTLKEVVQHLEEL